MKVDFEERGDEFDEVAATLRKVASARLPAKELSYVIANSEDMKTIVSLFKVRKKNTRIVLYHYTLNYSIHA